MRLVLLDRDGVLNEDRPQSVRTPGDLVLLPRAAEAVARLNRAGIRVVVVTNQSIVGRGIIDGAMLDRIHDRLRDELARAGARLDAILVAPDAPDAATARRKPGDAMLREAMDRFGAIGGETAMIGDALRDLAELRIALEAGLGLPGGREGPDAAAAVVGDGGGKADHAASVNRNG